MGRSAPVAASRSAACACRPVRMPSSRYRLVAFHISFSRFTSIRSMSRRITVPSMLRTLHVHSQAWMAPASMGQPARWHASRVVLLGMIWRGCAPMGGRIRSSIASNAFAAPSSSPVSIHSSMACRRMLASSPGEGRPGVCVGRPWSCVVVVRSPAAGVPRARTRR